MISPNPIRYSCQKCRTILFEEKDVVPHEAGEGSKGFIHKLHHLRPKAGAVRCASIFLTEAAFWGSVGENSGKILCKNEKCNLGVGSYSWSGSTCNCGKWVTPAFMISAGRVDALPTEPVATSGLRISFPTHVAPPSSETPAERIDE